MKINKNILLKYVFYGTCILIFAITFYAFVNNYQHYRAIREKTVVSDLDSDYMLYKNNIIKIDSILTNNKQNGELNNVLNKTLLIMKKDGPFKFLPGDSIGYLELYNLNDYFIESVYNDAWISSIRSLINSTEYDEMISIVINNANYIKKDFLNNSNYFNNYNNKLRNNINDKYHLILKNYKEFSLIILDICSKLGDNNV